MVCSIVILLQITINPEPKQNLQQQKDMFAPYHNDNAIVVLHEVSHTRGFNSKNRRKLQPHTHQNFQFTGYQVAAVRLPNQLSLVKKSSIL